MSEVGRGTCLGIGGTNARTAVCEAGDISGFEAIDTPPQATEFFEWMARKVLDSAEAGSEWLVAGFPGPVSHDGQWVGPMANVPGVADRPVTLHQKLEEADPAVSRLLASGFTLVAVNDGELSAHAAANEMSDGHERVAALINGSGVGAGLVILDKNVVDLEVYRADKDNPLEIGHIALSADPTDTYENRYSGPALARTYKVASTKQLFHKHPAWKRVGEATAQIALLLGVMHGADLVVPCGGVGSGGTAQVSEASQGGIGVNSSFRQ